MQSYWFRSTASNEQILKVPIRISVSLLIIPLVLSVERRPAWLWILVLCVVVSHLSNNVHRMYDKTPVETSSVFDYRSDWDDRDQSRFTADTDYSNNKLRIFDTRLHKKIMLDETHNLYAANTIRSASLEYGSGRPGDQSSGRILRPSCFVRDLWETSISYDYSRTFWRSGDWVNNWSLIALDWVRWVRTEKNNEEPLQTWAQFRLRSRRERGSVKSRVIQKRKPMLSGQGQSHMGLAERSRKRSAGKSQWDVVEGNKFEERCRVWVIMFKRFRHGSNFNFLQEHPVCWSPVHQFDCDQRSAIHKRRNDCGRY